MFRRIGDALRTLLQPTWDRRLVSLHAEARQIISELDDISERLTLVAAREAKRRSRAARHDLADPPPPPETTELAPHVAVSGRGSRKAELWRRARERGLLGTQHPSHEETG